MHKKAPTVIGAKQRNHTANMSDVYRQNYNFKLVHGTWSKFIGEFAKPTSDIECAWFTTLTTQYTLTLSSARRSIDRFVSLIRCDMYQVRLIWFAERYDAKDGYHLHAIVCSTAPRKKLNDYWSTAAKPNKNHEIAISHANQKAIVHDIKESKLHKSRSAFVKYSNRGGGASYMSKYVSKGGTGIDYDIVI